MKKTTSQPVKPGRQLMLGNEAVAKAAWSKGLNLFAAYAGTPSTEIGDTVGTFEGLYGEWSTNEAVAAGVAQGAAYVGGSAMVAFKHVGANVASDYLNNFARTRLTPGGALLIVVADDPGMHSSQNAQDSRILLAHMADIPILAPADSQDAWDLTRYGLELSKETCYPVALWMTTRVCHSSTVVDVPPEQARRMENLVSRFEPQPHFKSVPANAMPSNRQVVTEFLPRFAEISEKCPYNRMEMRSDRVGVISCGVASRYAEEMMPDASHLKLAVVYPLPKKLIFQFVAGLKEVLILEEGARYLEKELLAMGLRVRGKASPWCGEELEPASLRTYFLGDGVAPKAPLDVPRRPPVLCPGCPHAATYEALHQVDRERKKRRLPPLNRPGDIGCYALGEMHTITCMGASITQLHGMVVGLEQKWFEAEVAGVDAEGLGPLRDADLVRYSDGKLAIKGAVTRVEHKSEWRQLLTGIGMPAGRKAAKALYDKANDEIGANWALIGDSTLFHSGAPGILNITHNGGRGNILVFNNSYTAMTGGQDHPGTDKLMQGGHTTAIKIQDFVRGLGVKASNIKIVDPFDQPATIDAMRKEMAKPELSVIITNRVCNNERDLFQRGEPYHVERDRCMACGICLDLDCAAIIEVEGKPAIQPDLCTGCSVCAQVCPEKFGAILPGRDDTRFDVQSLPEKSKWFSSFRNLADNKVINILAVGVGGQGVLTASSLVAELGLRTLGHGAKADVHGMSQLGGEVNSHVRIGSQVVQSPLIPAGSVDIILGLEPMEAARHAHMLSDGGLVLTATNKIPSSAIARGKAKYPDDVLDRLMEMGVSTVALDAWSASHKIGDPRVANTFMLGALSRLLPIPEEAWRHAIAERFHKAVEKNLQAFEEGRRAVQLPPATAVASVRTNTAPTVNR
jgi:indolepyruvate ferredoxin oxidoreductase beta subunit